MVTTVDEVTVFSQEKVKSVTPDYAEVLELPEEERMGKRVEIYKNTKHFGNEGTGWTGMSLMRLVNILQ